MCIRFFTPQDMVLTALVQAETRSSTINWQALRARKASADLVPAAPKAAPVSCSGCKKGLLFPAGSLFEHHTPCMHAAHVLIFFMYVSVTYIHVPYTHARAHAQI